MTDVNLYVEEICHFFEKYDMFREFEKRPSASFIIHTYQLIKKLDEEIEKLNFKIRGMKEEELKLIERGIELISEMKDLNKQLGHDANGSPVFE